MEERVLVGMRDQGQRGVGADHNVELIIVDVERLRRQGLRIMSGRDEKLVNCSALVLRGAGC